MTLRLTAKHLTGGNNDELTFNISALCNIVIAVCFLVRSCKEEEQSSNSGLDHSHHISEMEENKLDEGDRDGADGSFGSITLSEAINQPLFKKSKSQVVFL